MNDNQSSLTCMLSVWGLAILAAILAAVLLMLLGDWRFVQAVFAAIIIAIIVGALLQWIACRPLPPQGHIPSSGSVPNPVPTSKASAASAVEQARAGATPEPATAAAKAASDARGGMKPSTPLPGEAELAARKGTWTYSGGDDADADEETAADAAALAEEAAAKTVEAESPKPAEPEAPEPAAAAPAASEGDGTRPATLDGPRGGTADNLKEIKGIGPKLEKVCNDLGFYHFDQIANWTADEVAWVNENLVGFKGRVSRDNWVEQAKILAAGGETEFSKRVEDGDVY